MSSDGLLAIALLVGILAIAVAVCVLVDRLTARKAKRIGVDRRILAERRKQSLMIGVAALIFLCFAFAFFLNHGKEGSPGNLSRVPPPSQEFGRRVGLICGVAAALGMLAIFWLRARWLYHDPVVAEATKIGMAGDWPAAERLLRDGIERKGQTPKLAHGLGVALVAQEKWAEALKWFECAEESAGPLARMSRGNKALVLWKLGRPAEAAGILAELRVREPNDIRYACNYSRILAELGRRDEARQQLTEAEILLAKSSVGARFADKGLVAEIEDLRRIIDGTKPDAGGLSDGIG